MGKSLDEVLDGRMRSGGDYPPWWPEDASQLPEGENIVGIVRQIRDDPWFEEEDDDSDRSTPAPILEVQTKENLYSTRTHKNLVSLIEEWDVQVGDLVKIEYAGKYSAEGGTGYNYKMGCVPQDEFDEYGIDPEEYGGSPSPPSDTDTGTSEPEQLSADEVVEDDDELEDFEDFEPEEDSGAISKDVIQFVEQLMDYNDEMPLEELDDYLNEVREFGVDAAKAATVAGFTIDDDVVKG